MSSSERSRRAVLASGLAALAFGQGGCNLRPIYGGERGQAVAAELAQIAVRAPNAKLHQQVQREIEEALNPDGLVLDQPYELLVEVELFQTDLAIQLEGTATRRDLYLLTSYLLRRKGEQRPLVSSAVRTVASYNIARQPYAELAARWDAERRVAADAAQEIRTRLSLYFRNQTA